MPARPSAARGRDARVPGLAQAAAWPAGVCGLPGRLRLYVCGLVPVALHRRESLLARRAGHQELCDGHAQDRVPRHGQADYAQALVRSAAAPPYRARRRDRAGRAILQYAGREYAREGIVYADADPLAALYRGLAAALASGHAPGLVGRAPAWLAGLGTPARRRGAGALYRWADGADDRRAAWADAARAAGRLAATASGRVS